MNPYSRKVLSCFSHVQLFVMLWSIALWICPWGSPGKNTGVACHFLLQEIFLIQGLNPCLPHCSQSLPFEHQGSCKHTIHSFYLASHVAQWQRIHLSMQETQETLILSLGWEDPLEKGMATHSGILVWSIP